MIVLDTHAWVWWLDDPDQLSDAADGAIAAADEVAISTMSVWEVGMLAAKNRVRLAPDVGSWCRRALAGTKIRLVDVDFEIALEGVALAAQIPDPADALIAATARAFRVPVVTKDRRMQGAGVLETIW